MSGREDSVFVVVERTAACAYWMDHWGPQPENGWSMLEQEESEPATAFEPRLKIALDRHGTDSTTCIVFVVGSASDAAALSARWTLATMLATALTRGGGGCLRLAVGHAPWQDAATSIDGLAEDLIETWGDAGLTLDIRPGPRWIPSGVAYARRPASPAASAQPA